jgi:hypothetical protein
MLRSILLLTLLLAGMTNSEPAPNFATPDGWQQWHSGDGQWSMWLPQETEAGEQDVFLVLSAGNHRDQWLSAWLGGAEIVWEDSLKAGGLVWPGVIADSGARRGLVAVSAGGGWTFGAIAPKDQWETYAGAFNAILKGGTQ